MDLYDACGSSEWMELDDEPEPERELGDLGCSTSPGRPGFGRSWLPRSQEAGQIVPYEALICFGAWYEVVAENVSVVRVCY